MHTNAVDSAIATYLGSVPLVGYAANLLVESSDPIVHVVVGVVMVCVSAMLVPLIRWMIRRMDGHSKQDQKLVEAREAREDRRLGLHDKQVQALAALVGHVELLIAGHREVLARLDALPKRITDRLNRSEPYDPDGDQES